MDVSIIKTVARVIDNVGVIVSISTNPISAGIHLSLFSTGKYIAETK
jgi:uncharacterized membrane protein